MILVNNLVLSVLLCYLIYTPSSCSHVKKSLDLSSLVNILNSLNISAINLGTLVNSIQPWIVAESSHPVHQEMVDFPVTPLNCSATEYQNIFDGAILEEDRFIVDFVPFGYDLDKLEMRLYEGYDIVSAYVIYEAPLTQTAKMKPFYFEIVKESARFSRFRDKIIYLKANISDLGKHIPKSGRKSWKLENSMRYEIIRLFKSLHITHPRYNLKTSLIAAANRDNALAIQNDADEIILRHALLHLSRCKFRKDLAYPIFTPCLAFKKNFHWLQGNLAGEVCLSGTSNISQVLKRAIWGQGPRLWPLNFMLKEGNTLRHVGRNVPGDKHKHVHCKSHTGIFSAVHLSSVAEPAEEWLKAISVIESKDKNILKPDFISSLKNQKLTADIIFQSSVKPWCVKSKMQKNSSSMIIVSSLSDDAKLLVNNSIPWIVRKFPENFPFLAPAWIKIDFYTENVTFTYRNKTFDPTWTDDC